MTDQIIIQKLGPGQWRTIYPKIVEDTYDLFWEINEMIETQPRKAENQLKSLIKACGNGNIDAILQLGQLYNETSRPIEGNALIYKAHTLSLDAFPFDFDFDSDELLWGHIDNRPVLRTFAAIGIEYMKERQYQKAIDKFEQLLKLNSRDNQGVRYLIPECFMFLKKYDQLLNHLSNTEDDSSLEYLFAKVVALYKTDDFENAKLALKEAKLKHPFVAEELVKNKHEFPVDEFDRQFHGVPMGSRQEAFLYWDRTKELWNKDEDLLQFLSKN